MTPLDILLVVSLALIVIGVGLLIALPFLRTVDDGSMVLTTYVKPVGQPWIKIDEVTIPSPEPTPLEYAVARVLMNEPIASAARNEGVEIKELMDELRKCQPTN